jgi:hypothetical protein
MSNTDSKNQAPSWTNPLQNNNAALMAVGYLAGIAAAKFTFFDLATWNYIFMSIGGVAFAGVSYILNRKNAVISTAANLPEVKNIELDKKISGTAAMEAATPDNVVAK